MQLTATPTADPMRVSRRALDVEDYIDVLRRHKHWIVGPAFLGLVLAVVVAYLMPDVYLSEATIRVVPSQVPESLVQSNVTTDLSKRLLTMSQTIRSRDKLVNLIEKHQLYPSERAKEPMLDVVERMRKVVDVRPMAGARSRPDSAWAYRISFRYQDRLKAKAVVDDLVSTLMNENTEQLTSESTLTTKFLDDEWQASKNKLEETDKKLSAFRSQNAGRMPGEAEMFIQQIGVLQGNISSYQNGLSRIAQERTMMQAEMQSLLNQRKSLQPPTPETVAASAPPPVVNRRLQEAEQQLQRAETNVANLRERLNDAHPDLRVAIENRDQLLKRRDEAMQADPVARTPSAAAPSSYVPRQVMEAYQRAVQDKEVEIDRLKGRMAAKDIEEQQIRLQLTQAEQRIGSYQGRISGMPVSQQQYLQLEQERVMAARSYEDLSRRRDMSERSTRIFQQARGESLSVMDPGSLPTKPELPNRPLVVGAGMAAGLVIGLALASARELKDSSLKNLKDVRAYTQLNVLGSVPLLENEAITRRRRRILLLGWATAVLVGCIIMAASVAYYATYVRT